LALRQIVWADRPQVLRGRLGKICGSGRG